MSKIKNWSKEDSMGGSSGSNEMWSHDSGQYFVQVRQLTSLEDGEWAVDKLDSKADREPLGFLDTKAEAMDRAREWMRNHPNPSFENPFTN